MLRRRERGKGSSQPCKALELAKGVGLLLCARVRELLSSARSLCCTDRFALRAMVRHAPSSRTCALLLNIALLAGAQNNHASCSDWAATGECENNPGYMLTNCKDACDLQTMEVAASFYELSAETASGGTLDFETLRDKVVLITNVASE